MEKEIILPEELNDFFVLTKIQYKLSDGFLIIVAGNCLIKEEVVESKEKPIVQILLYEKSNGLYLYKDNLESFEFNTYNSAKNFIMSLPNFKAIELLMIVNGYYIESMNDRVIH